MNLIKKCSLTDIFKCYILLNFIYVFCVFAILHSSVFYSSCILFTHCTLEVSTYCTKSKVVRFVKKKKKKKDVTRKVILNAVPAPLPAHPPVIGDAPLCRADR